MKTVFIPIEVTIDRVEPDGSYEVSESSKSLPVFLVRHRIKPENCFETKKELVAEEMIRVCQLSIKKKVELDALYVKEISDLNKHMEES